MDVNLFYDLLSLKHRLDFLDLFLVHLDLIPLNLDSILEAFALGLSLAECGAEL